jgi:hypothetical protein
LLNGFSESKRIIDEKIIREVIKNLEGPSPRKFKPRKISGFVKRTHPIFSGRTLSFRKIAVILLSLLGLGVTFFLMFGFLRYGHSNQRGIESMWTSLFHTERSLATIPKTTTIKTSNADVSYPPVETRALPVKAPQPAVSPSVSLMRVNKETRSTEYTVVKTGQSISRLAQRYYGRSNITRADFILDFNPEITNANLISINQKVRIPKITEESLIVKSSDRTCKINVGTFWSPQFAELYRNEPSLKGKGIEIVAKKAAPNEIWYRVFVGKFNNEDEALKVISILRYKKLLPLFTAEPKL